MTSEIKDGRTPIKSCPWWARFATAPNGWIIAYCSLDACKVEKDKGRVWEGPTKGERCALGFSKAMAKTGPSVIFYHPRTGFKDEVVVPTRWMSNKAWNCVVEWFRDMAEREAFLSWGEIESQTREVINQAWNTQAWNT